jgi:rsbT co-antagonist protein RsbR
MRPTAIPELLAKFDIAPSDLDRVRAAGAVLKPRLDEFIAEFYEWMASAPEYKVFFGSNTARLERVKPMQRANWASFLDANIDQRWIDARRHVGQVHAHIDLPNDIYFAAMSKSAAIMVRQLREARPPVKDVDATVASIGKLMFLDTFLVIEEIAHISREKISVSTRALMEMSTPVTPIWEGILLLPLLGILDSQRTQDIMSKTLAKIAETRAKVLVMDISGVGAMDTAVANQLLKITKATQLMGCETILSGLSPAIARTLVDLGVNVGEVRTTATLRDSFELALRATGVDVRRLGAS